MAAMATVSLLAVSEPSSVGQLPNDHSNRHHVNPIFRNCKQKASFLQSLCSRGQVEETSQLLLELDGNGFSRCLPSTFAHNNLLKSFIKQGRLDDARILFDEMPFRNEFSWSTIISAYSWCGNSLEAFHLFEEMLEEGFRPNDFALGCLLKASSFLREVSTARQLHGWLTRVGLGQDAELRASLITMYSNYGLLDDARQVFDEVPISSLDDALSWNSIIAAYILNGCLVEAFQLFGAMLSTGLSTPTEQTFASIINACGSVGAERYGMVTHGRIIKTGLIHATMVGNSLITFYSRCEKLEDANRSFKLISEKDVVSWNAIIAGNEQNGEGKAAIDVFHCMLRYGALVQPNRITFLSVIRAISGVSALKYGREIHGRMIRSGLELEISIANSLITMYSKCREMDKARVVFDRAPFKDVVTWNSMLTVYEQYEQWENCFKLFKEMQLSRIKPDDHTFTVILTAASSNASGSKYLRGGKEIHGYILRRTSSVRMATSTCNAILTMYTKLNRMADTEKIFDGMGIRDSYSWNAMMDGYSMNGRPSDAIMIFLDMHEQFLPVDNFTFSVVLTACGRLVSLQLGKQFHAIIIKYSHLKSFTGKTCVLSINNALISMYSKCGSIEDATKVFEKMASKDVFSWTAMITGYAHHGMAFESLQLFKRMEENNVKPNSITFLGLLTACAHAGLVDEGTHYFSSMRTDHSLKPRIEHYACMVDLFSRLGDFESAEKLVEAGTALLDPNHGDSLSLWRVLLGGCHAHKQLQLGVHAATRILEAEPDDETTHILLSNLYATSGMWEDATRVRKLMREKGLKKETGYSWIEAENKRHILVAGDISHPLRKEIYEKMEELDSSCRAIGYVPRTADVRHDVAELQKEIIVSFHSEKLAVSLGLLQSLPRRSKAAIRVIKNLRICRDCHNWMKFVSQVEGKEIVIRDSRRFHFFKDGKCSCSDYW
ncbi:putative pentatricopeptide repeat-containing protein At5g52630 [Macadamia integrifolia]|uniref:putative pentatricopeptide repeat-containing protein At5g52630 n=1 Tax=Macadamia integrifolia TaxID=60698 RepID=UPI001C4E939F|nr:putative pentatricopeptide repeat-containing protein At5g52630 [Macadamia integrifolia]